MKAIFDVALLVLTISLFVIANGFDKCKHCGATRGRSSTAHCVNCRKEMVPKYPYARKIFFVIACVLVVLMLVYRRLFV